jgi:hypothetical protein
MESYQSSSFNLHKQQEQKLTKLQIYNGIGNGIKTDSLIMIS